MNTLTIIKGVKLRLYPNVHQIDQLWQMFGNNRFVWNQMLAMAKQRYINNPNSHFVNEYGMNYLLKRLKQEYPFLKESDSTSLQVANHNLVQSFNQKKKIIRRHIMGSIQKVLPIFVMKGVNNNDATRISSRRYFVF